MPSTGPVSEAPLIRYSRWALALTVACMPLYVVRWHIGPLPTTLLENLTLLTATLYALTVWRYRGPLPRRTPYEIPIALLLLAGIIAIFVAPDHRGALGIFRAYVVEPIVIYYVAIAVLGSPSTLQSVLAAWAVSAVLFALLQMVTFFNALLNGGLHPGHAAAAFGINPNQVAMYLEPLIGVAAGLALFTRGRQRWAAVAVLSILLPAELTTLSRGGLLALAALALVAILTVRQPLMRLGVIALTSIGAVALSQLPLISSRIAHALDPVEGTFYNRERIWVSTFSMLHDHPVFGAGLNAYQIVMAPYRLADSNIPPEQYPHNLWLTVWTEMGLLGLFAFVYVLAGLAVQPWRALRKATGFNRALLWGLGTAFLMIAVHGLVDSPYWKNDLSLEFWTLAALEVVSLRAIRQGVPANG